MGLISINIYLISRPSLHFQLQQIHVLSEIIFSFLHFDNQLNYRYLKRFNDYKLYFPFKFVAYRVQGAHETFRMFTYQLNTALNNEGSTHRCILVTILQYSLFFYYNARKGKYTFCWCIYILSKTEVPWDQDSSISKFYSPIVRSYKLLLVYIRL